MQYFNIQVASQLSGVASATIRAWEKRYNAVTPDRADNKHRLYSEKDIEKISLLFKLTEVGQSIGKIAHLELDELKEIYSTLLHRPYDDKKNVSNELSDSDFEKIRMSLYLSLVAYKIDILSHELEKAQNTLSPKDFALKIIVPLFREIGSKVALGEFSVTQEHTLSALTSFYAGQMIGRHYQNNKRNDLIIITTPEGEFHSIGILASALICIHHGVKIIYLGPNTPANSLAEMSNALNAKAILIGTMRGLVNSESNVLENYLEQLQSLLTKKTDILVGGPIKSQTKNVLEKKKINYFSSLENFNQFIEKF